MTPQTLAGLHEAAFTVDRSWSASEFEGLVANPFTFVIGQAHGFALIRTLAGETELLTLAVDPAHHRQGIAKSLLTRWLDNTQSDAKRAFLEVAADNMAAMALYEGLGFEISATRGAYYTRNTARPVDALMMQRRLTHGQMPDSTQQAPKSG